MADYASRIRSVAEAAREDGLGAVLVGPGADLQWLLGFSNASFERLTSLVIVPGREPVLVVPALERAGWAGHDEGLDIRTWKDGENAHSLVASLLPPEATAIGVDAHTPALHLFAFERTLRGAELVPAAALDSLRMRKTPEEVDALADAAAAIDRVQARVGEWLRAGRTENEVAADIAAAIVEEGHERADFVIVGSGPNGASPHHEASDRVIQPGDAVVVDIGGPAASGYNSDCTRTFLVAGGDPDPELAIVHEVVRRAQQVATDAVRPGVAAEEIDAAAVAVIEGAGYWDFILSRTGHGIGLEVHEAPYLVRGNATPLEPGMAFSVEPGIYLPGRFGVRIEDIVVVTDDGVRSLNESPRGLVVVG